MIAGSEKCCLYQAVWHSRENYEYQPSRKAEHAEVFLKDFDRWLHADGYQGYHKLRSNIRVVGYWAHARRKVDEALQTLPKEKRQDSLRHINACVLGWRPFYTPGDLTGTFDLH